MRQSVCLVKYSRPHRNYAVEKKKLHAKKGKIQYTNKEGLSGIYKELSLNIQIYETHFCLSYTHKY